MCWPQKPSPQLGQCVTLPEGSSCPCCAAFRSQIPTRGRCPGSVSRAQPARESFPWPRTLGFLGSGSHTHSAVDMQACVFAWPMPSFLPHKAWVACLRRLPGPRSGCARERGLRAAALRPPRHFPGSMGILLPAGAGASCFLVLCCESRCVFCVHGASRVAGSCVQVHVRCFTNPGTCFREADAF